jgi:hypothetical protein
MALSSSGSNVGALANVSAHIFHTLNTAYPGSINWCGWYVAVFCCPSAAASPSINPPPPFPLSPPSFLPPPSPPLTLLPPVSVTCIPWHDANRPGTSPTPRSAASSSDRFKAAAPSHAYRSTRACAARVPGGKTALLCLMCTSFPDTSPAIPRATGVADVAAAPCSGLSRDFAPPVKSWFLSFAAAANRARLLLFWTLIRPT